MRTSALLLFLITTAGCNRGTNTGETHHGHEHNVQSAHHHEGGSTHEHDVETAQITVWSSGFEIFAEYAAPVAGKLSRFVVHVSELATGEPRSSGTLKFTFEQAQTQFDHLQARPTRPGIYTSGITFPQPGDWKAKAVIPGATNAVLDLGIIQVFPSEHEAAHADFPEPPEGITFLKEQQWRIQVKTQPATTRSLTERLPLPASVGPAPNGKATIHAPLTGTLRGSAPGRFPEIGDSVAEGDLLAWIEPGFDEFTMNFVQAEADAARTQAALKQAEAAYQRIKSLVEQNARSVRELQEAEAAYLTARAEAEAALSVQTIYRTSGAVSTNGTLAVALVSPIRGIIERVGIGMGERIGSGRPLFTIINPERVHVRAEAPEALLRRLDFSSDALLQLFTHKELIAIGQDAKRTVGIEIDPNSRALPVTYAVANPDGKLHVGAMGTLHVATGSATNALAIPRSAVVEEDGVPVVFVQVSGEIFQKRTVELGIREGDWVEAKAGVMPGERVVSDGAYSILLSTKSGSIPSHGHAH